MIILILLYIMYYNATFKVQVYNDDVISKWRHAYGYKINCVLLILSLDYLWPKMEHAIVMINQNFSLFCVSNSLLCCDGLTSPAQCAEQYSISFTDQSLSSDSDYFVRYTYPDGATTDSSAQLLANGCVLTSQSPGTDRCYWIAICTCRACIQ